MTSTNPEPRPVTYRAPNIEITVTKRDTFGPVPRYDVTDHSVGDHGYRYDGQTWFQTNRLLERLGVTMGDRRTLFDGRSVRVNMPAEPGPDARPTPWKLSAGKRSTNWTGRRFIAFTGTRCNELGVELQRTVTVIVRHDRQGPELATGREARRIALDALDTAGITEVHQTIDAAEVVL